MSTTGRSCMGVVLLLLVLSMTILASTSEAKPLVAIVPLQNLSNCYLPDIEEVGADLLSAALFDTGEFALVERTQVEAVLREQNELLGGRFSTEGIESKIGQLLGADILVTGAVLSCAHDESVEITLGVKSRITVLTLRVSVKVFRVDTAELLFVGQEEALGRTIKVGWLTTLSEAEPADVLEKVLAVLSSEIAATVELGAEREQFQMVSVSISTNPAGADIEMDGYFVGNTPLVLPLQLDSIRQIRLEMAGHEAWEKTVRVFEGLTVDVALSPLSGD